MSVVGQSDMRGSAARRKPPVLGTPCSWSSGRHGHALLAAAAVHTVPKRGSCRGATACCGMPILALSGVGTSAAAPPTIR
eukprot:scaffold27246_cov114-Isochrysis_galbana.AAC.8